MSYYHNVILKVHVLLKQQYKHNGHNVVISLKSETQLKNVSQEEFNDTIRIEN